MLSTFTCSENYVICLQKAKSSGLVFSFSSSLSPLSYRRLNWIWEIISDSLVLHNQVIDKQGWNSALLLLSVEPYIARGGKGTASWLPGDSLSWGLLYCLAEKPWLRYFWKRRLMKSALKHQRWFRIKEWARYGWPMTVIPAFGGWRISSLKQAWVTQQDCVLQSIKNTGTKLLIAVVHYLHVLHSSCLYTT